MPEKGYRSFLAKLLLALSWGGCILWLSLDPSPPVPETALLGWDKFQHAAAYGGLTFFCGRTFAVLMPGSSRAWLWGTAVSVGFGAFLEVLQGLCTTTRTAEAGDLLADAVGALAVYLMATAGSRKSRTAGK